jgi:hypothetical protein
LLFIDVEARSMAVETASARKGYRRSFRLLKKEKNVISLSPPEWIYTNFSACESVTGKRRLKRAYVAGRTKKDRVIFLTPAHPKNQLPRTIGERYMKMGGYPGAHAE